MKSLLQHLRERGDYVAIENGKLAIKPASGIPVPPDWLKSHQQKLLESIIQETGNNAYYFNDYKASKFHNGIAGGIMLILVDVITQKEITAFFNADLTYQRNGKNHNKGDSRPKGEFYVSEKSYFVKLWKASGLTLPRGKTSDLYKYMGHLKGIIFTGEIDPKKPNKIKNGSLVPYNSKRVFGKLQQNWTDISTNDRHHFDIISTISRHHFDKASTSISDNDFQSGQLQPALQPIPSACQNNHVNKLIRNDVTSEDITSFNTSNIECIKTARPEEQSTDEWLADYDTSIDDIEAEWNERFES